MLELRNIYKDYYIDKKPLHVLKDVNLSFPRHQFVSLLGPSGCGKTTTLNIIGGLDQYTDGDLIIEGRSTKDYTSEDWDAYRNVRIGFVFQSYNLITHLNVRQNVEMGMQLAGIRAEERKQRATEALKAVGLGDVIEKDVTKLSGGQMQRVAIARAIVNDPDIILADEPTGALDSETSIEVLDLLKEVSKERLVIMVTHNEYLANRYSDRIIRMLDGVITDDSAPYEIDEKTQVETKQVKRTKMSFATALKSSLRNIATKKGRTIMTSIAASFGIIGVGLVLAVSNGFQNYVDRMEATTLSAYPIGIYGTSVMFSDDYLYEDPPEIYPEEQEIRVLDDSVVLSKIVNVEQNIVTRAQLEVLKRDYLETGYADSILTNYNTNMHLTTTRPLEDGSMEVFSHGENNLTWNNMIVPTPGGSFHQLFGRNEYIDKYYEPIAGRYPQEGSINEVVLVVDRHNQLYYSDLYDLGLIEELDSRDIEGKVIPFDSTIITEKKYKVFTNDEFYQQETTPGKEKFTITDLGLQTEANPLNLQKEVNRYTLPTQEEIEALYNDPTKGVELEIVGILRLREESIYTEFMQTGIAYTPELADYMFEQNNKGEFVRNFEKAFSQNIPDSMFSNLIETMTKEFETGEYGEDPTAMGLYLVTQGIPNPINPDETIQIFNFYDPLQPDSSAAGLKRLSLQDYFDRATIYNATFVQRDADGNPTDYDPYATQDKEDRERRYFMDSFDAFIPYPPTLEDENVHDDWVSVSYRDLFYSPYHSIAIFPASKAGKDKILDGIKEYNKIQNEIWHAMGLKGNSPYFINETDILSNVSESLSILVQVISIVLLIFSSISLITSAVMIGIITSASVIERTKEIGILRALGARKRDITRLFQAETFIVGIAAGIFGIAIVLLISLPINVLLNRAFPFVGLGRIANLNAWHAIVLVLINLAITMLASLIPSRNAAKKEPVDALRNE